jgi:predicted DNA-binding protein
MPSDSDAPESEFPAFLGANVPEEMKERVEAAARRTGRTVSGWLRQALRRRLDAEERIREQSRQPVEK